MISDVKGRRIKDRLGFTGECGVAWGFVEREFLSVQPAVRGDSSRTRRAAIQEEGPMRQTPLWGRGGFAAQAGDCTRISVVSEGSFHGGQHTSMEKVMLAGIAEATVGDATAVCVP